MILDLAMRNKDPTNQVPALNVKQQEVINPLAVSYSKLWL